MFPSVHPLCYRLSVHPSVHLFVHLFFDPFSRRPDGTAPEDWLEGEGIAELLVPQSLYEDQLLRRR